MIPTLNQTMANELDTIKIRIESYLAQHDMDQYKVQIWIESKTYEFSGAQGIFPVLVVKIGRKKKVLELVDLVEEFDTTDFPEIISALAEDPDLVDNRGLAGELWY